MTGDTHQERSSKEPVTFRRVLDSVSAYLDYQREEGVQNVVCTPDTVRALSDVPDAGQVQMASPLSAEATTACHDVLLRVAKEAAACQRCELHVGRGQVVPGQGSHNPDIMFIGEAPGAEEDRQGLAFVGRAGQLLTKMIEAMGYTRDEVFIANINKCRPPENRAPTREEMDTCMPFLKQQIAALQPKVIVAMGATAVKGLLDVPTGITRLRGTWMMFEGIDLMPTFHPAYLLRNPPAKREVWEDLKAVLKHLGREPPPRKARG